MIKVVSSGKVTGAATIFSGDGYLLSVTVLTDGVNDGHIVVYDNTSASGDADILANVRCPAASLSKTVSFFPTAAEVGLHYTVTGTGASGIVTYSEHARH